MEAADQAEVKLDRPIGLAGGVALVIGGVIGMGIYALIAAAGQASGLVQRPGPAHILRRRGD